MDGIEPDSVNEQAIYPPPDLAVLQAHPELHHYTTLSGLQGILATRTVWATDYRNLNDTSEVRLLREPLVAAFEPRFRELLREKQRKSFRIKRAVQESGGLLKVSKDMARSWVGSLYQTTFDNDHEFGLTAFVASFCTHTSGRHSYERDHGLLSQWRAYGHGDGCCIVFDTQALSEMMLAEFKAHYYVHLSLGEVHYAANGTPIDQLLPELPGLLTCGEQFLSTLLDRRSPAEVVEDACAPFIAGTTLYKHQSFREECEVRIVAMPGTRRLLERLLSEYSQAKPMPIKAVRRSGTKRYIALFDGLGDLPIKKIIVGPSRNQSANLQQVRRLVGEKIKVSASEIPYTE